MPPETRPDLRLRRPRRMERGSRGRRRPRVRRVKGSVRAAARLRGRAQLWSQMPAVVAAPSMQSHDAGSGSLHPLHVPTNHAARFSRAAGSRRRSAAAFPTEVGASPGCGHSLRRRCLSQAGGADEQDALHFVGRTGQLRLHSEPGQGGRVDTRWLPWPIFGAKERHPQRCDGMRRLAWVASNLQRGTLTSSHVPVRRRGWQTYLHA